MSDWVDDLDWEGVIALGDELDKDNENGGFVYGDLYEDDRV